ncbi:MAG: tRNA-dihydrouridine synthase family protein [Deltaproteobacteria bacterium]|nr:tRNA-dihydrouridine synthase family protein [Deltaproteobacteria bacterium]
MDKLDTPLIGLSYPWLAPLAGHTDLVFRTLCREQGAAVACTEMVSAKGLIYAESKHSKYNATKELLQTTKFDAPLVVQLFGDDPEILAQAVTLLRSWGFGWFDLNLGCAVPKVTRTGAGAALAKDIHKTLACAKAMIEAAGPDQQAGLASRVGFKFRLGWTQEEENYLELARGLEQCGAAWLTLHPRYARQGFSGRANHAALAKLVQAVQTPVIASGDLSDAGTALHIAQQSGVAGVMFARGALYNPAIFYDYLLLLKKSLENNGDKAEDKSIRAEPEFLRKLILRHAELAQTMSHAPEQFLFKMRGAISCYVKDLRGSKALRVSIFRCASWVEFYQLVEDFFGGQHAGD